MAAGRDYIPVSSFADIDGPALMMILICVAIAFVESLTFWVLGGTPAVSQAPRARHQPQRDAGNVERLDHARKRTGRRVAAAVAAAALAVGAGHSGVQEAAAATTGVTIGADASATPQTQTSVSRTRRDIALQDVARSADRLQRDGERVSFRRLAAELGTSKSKVERVLAAAGVSIMDVC